MNRAQANAVISDDDVPPSLRSFIDVLLNGDCEGYSNIVPPIYPTNVNECESNVKNGGARRDSNPRPPAWPAGVLKLSMERSTASSRFR